MISDLQYHLRRARSEREIARRTAEPRAAAAHRQLAHLHVERALLLRAVRRAPVDNITPLRPRPVLGIRVPAPARPAVVDLPSLG